MNNTKIVRLQNDSELIADVIEIMEGQYVFQNPMEFDLQYSKTGVMHIMLQHFLPHKLVKENEVLIDKKDIVFITTPSDEFAEYYSNQVLSLKESEQDVSEYDKKLQEDLQEKAKKILLEAFSVIESEGSTLH
jgi:hypothetical protein